MPDDNVVRHVKTVGTKVFTIESTLSQVLHINHILVIIVVALELRQARS